MPDPEQIQATFRAYAAAIESRDRDALRACFTDDVVQVDPYPSPANVGPDAVMAFFEQTWAMTEKLQFIVGRTIVSAERGVFPFTVRSTVGGSVVEVDAVDVMTFSDDGRIAEITAYVDMAGMRAL
ncbi:MAG: nuclear transport factor 2 family protein [Acidimicrobiales bacterium]